jgi:hypothetical protein
MSSSDISSSTGLPIKEVLKIYLIAYNAAVTANRPYSVSSFGTSDLSDDYTTVTTVTYDFSSRGVMPAGTTKAQEIAYKKMNQCDRFCAMFLEPVKAQLQPYQASVELVVVEPKPTTMLIAHDDPEPFVLHSVLLIRTKDDSEIIFDGTPEQFGWPESNAIIDGEEFWDVFGCEYEDEDEDEDSEDEEQATNGYWPRVETSLREMLSGLNWESLGRMPASGREEYIRVESAERALNAAQLTWGW